MKIVTSAQMRRLDEAASRDFFLPSILLMENAAYEVARHAETRISGAGGKRITVVCGRGNNGGDGLAAARHLLRKGASVRVYLLSLELSGDAETNRRALERVTGDIFRPPSGDFLRSLKASDLIIDALFGTGLSKPVRGPFARAIRAINDSGRPVLAVDIPSGVSADTGEIMGEAVRADLTVTFALPKRGHFLPPGEELTGDLHVVDIGISLPLVNRLDSAVHLIDREEVSHRIPRRRKGAHKGTYGHLLLIAGSVGKAGAAALSASAALRTGAGLVTIACPKGINNILQRTVREAMTIPLPHSPEGGLSLEAEKGILTALPRFDAVALGPGLGEEPQTAELVRRMIRRIDLPLVLDADGLNAIGSKSGLLAERSAPTILTPHPGEMGRMIGKKSTDVQRDRLGVAARFSKERGVILVLKGAHSIVASPDGVLAVNPTGNPGMATAGTGDVLTGMIGALLAQGLAAREAAIAGVYLHGIAGDLAARRRGKIGMIAGDLVEEIPTALLDFG